MNLMTKRWKEDSSKPDRQHLTPTTVPPDGCDKLEGNNLVAMVTQFVLSALHPLPHSQY